MLYLTVKFFKTIICPTPVQRKECGVIGAHCSNVLNLSKVSKVLKAKKPLNLSPIKRDLKTLII